MTPTGTDTSLAPDLGAAPDMVAPDVRLMPVTDLVVVVNAEFDAWAAVATPPDWAGRFHPHAPDGFPAGWTLVSRMGRYTDGTDLTLVRRDAGGHLILRHETGKGYDRLGPVWLGESLAGLYETLRNTRDGIGWRGRKQEPQPTLAPVVAWLDEVLMGMFDPTDFEDAAEMTLVGLGAPLTRLPRAAYTC